MLINCSLRFPIVSTSRLPPKSGGACASLAQAAFSMLDEVDVAKEKQWQSTEAPQVRA